MSVNDFMEERCRMVEMLVREGAIKSEEVKRAMMKVPREIFVWKGTEPAAYYDTPQPLGRTSKTISEHDMIELMIEEMDLKPGLRVLEVGTGSGYNAALMAEEVTPSSKETKKKGHITTVERMSDLVKFASDNLERTGYSDRVSVHQGDGTLGYPEKSSKEIYDRIIVTAAAPHIPRYLVSQLQQEGMLLIPVGDKFVQTLLKVSKKPGELITKNICECMFVPLKGEDGYH
jgi:protein-L-isoaspartate(D-aspartate) O-methyltransferase